MRAYPLLAFICTVYLFLPTNAYAGSLTHVSDVISTSAPGTTTVSHTISFTVENTIPASGQIVIEPESGAFSVPVGFNYEDVDFSVSSGGPYSERQLAETASAAEDGVSINADTITITLNSSTAVSAGSQVVVELGTIAAYGTTSTHALINASSVGSYRIGIHTYNASSLLIDAGKTMIALVEPVAVSVDAEASAPNRFNGFPTGTVEADNPVIEISLNTDEPGNCRYATSSGVSYDSMVTSFTVWGTSTIHHVAVGDHTNGTSYTYYVRCSDLVGNINTDDFEISFTLGADPEFDGSVSAGDAGPGGVGSFLGGSAYLYQSTLTISGSASPGGRITVLRDGTNVATAQVAANGTFTVTPPAFERGTYTFSTYVTDRSGRRSSSHAATMSFGQGTHNTISNIIIPPTIVSDEESVPTSGTAHIYGEGVPGATIELLIDGSKKFSASTTKGVSGLQDGLWDITFPASALTRGTHILRARAVVPGQSASVVSTVLLLGVGEDPNPSAPRSADLNRDGKVNLVDFSILLSKWQKDDDIADINADGIVNIADFSIMLFQWTG